jgi:2-polyprenyl-6-hydroxyphenyl methylase/3-demethylubiquinone-9 3-methyltransferase
MLGGIMRGYYAGRLAAQRLRRVYEIAPPRVQRYLDAEIHHVLSRLPERGLVVELGCGYGRVALRLVAPGRRLVGIDTALESLVLASEARRLARLPLDGCQFVRMDAGVLGFREACVDAVVCVQNGICAFGIEPRLVLREAIRVTRPGGRILFASYADRFWPHRLEWFERQAAEALIGSIDYHRSRDGVIVCEDGFRAGIMSPEDFIRVCADFDSRPSITEVDESSVFCELHRGGTP